MFHRHYIAVKRNVSLNLFFSSHLNSHGSVELLSEEIEEVKAILPKVREKMASN